MIFYESLETYYKVYQKYKNFDQDTKDLYLLDENKKIIGKNDKYSNARLSYNTVNSKSSKSMEEDVKSYKKQVLDDDLISNKSLRISYLNSSKQISIIK